MTIKLVDYKTGNLSSVAAALDSLGQNSTIISHISELEIGDIIILPGVGSFDNAAQHLKAGGFYEYDFNGNRNKVIGICLGFHLMCQGSDEGSSDGLGLFKTYVRDFDGLALPLLNLGWCEVESAVPSFSGSHYFCHRYFVESTHNAVAHLERDGHSVCNVMNTGSFWGVQSHPERSGSIGLSLLKDIICNEP